MGPYLHGWPDPIVSGKRGRGDDASVANSQDVVAWELDTIAYTSFGLVRVGVFLWGECSERTGVFNSWKGKMTGKSSLLHVLTLVGLVLSLIGPMTATLTQAALPQQSGGTIVTFQEGVPGDTGTLDTTIKYNTSTTSYGSQVYGEWDTQETQGSNTPEIALLQFTNIFGDGVGQSSLGSTINQAPAAPTLVQPADDATDVSIPATLEVTVTDPDADPLDVTFYGRQVGGTAPAEDFTLIVIPDTQNMATSYPAVFNSMTQWISNTRVISNIVFVTHVGDIVNTASSTTEWERADAAFDILDAAGVPYSVGPGNHDLGGLYNNYFGISRFSSKPWYQGYYGSDNYNNYSFFSASGMDFIIINLQYNPDTARIHWADGLLQTYSSRRGIVVQHNLLNLNNSWYNQASYNALRDNPNLFLMLCGHMHSSTDGSAYRAETGDDGHTIHILLTDYQDYPNGGNGYLRLLTFRPASDEIFAQVYSPYVNTYLTNASNYEQFTMTYEMPGSSGGAYQVIGTRTGVSSGSIVSISWSGLGPLTEYEWYVAASDGVVTTTSGSPWSFTTSGAARSYFPIIFKNFKQYRGSRLYAYWDQRDVPYPAQVPGVVRSQRAP